MAPAAAVRGAVQRTFVPARVLSGFADDGHLQQIIGEYLATLEEPAKQRFNTLVAESRRVVAELAAFEPGDAVCQEIRSLYTDAIAAHPLFQGTFGQRPYRFAVVDLSQIVALQPWIEPRRDRVPEDADELLRFALPDGWDIPAEISFIQPSGPIQILTSNPALSGLHVELDSSASIVKIGAPKHLNLVQVVNFSGRHYLVNGYHRVADALHAGVTRMPALVTESILGVQDIQLPGIGPFNVGYVAGLKRPPLVADFGTPAAVDAKVRERRYGFLVDIQPRPLVIGI
jgi:hypothetical protein